ncbi:MAG TPA: CRISPR-associated protein, partial [Ignavibacteria bacterium]|nr:CRISPR-associated protein [Ignavibacteria bacterium]
MTYKKRIFGAAIVKAINSNYNADFSGQPRTLPNGTVYATDKAFKYAVKNYLKDVYVDEKIFYFKRFNEEFVPYSLDDAYAKMFPGNKETKDKKIVAKDILSCLDIRLFGATFAKKGKSSNIAISIHGPVQINHGVNIWSENNIFSEQIMSPFRNPDEKSEEKQATTLGRQSKLQEGHYLHHFSVNPKNLEEVVKLAGEGANTLTAGDVEKLKEAMSRGVTWYDSASKAGSENEALIWITLKENSKLVLPNLTQLVEMKP